MLRQSKITQAQVRAYDELGRHFMLPYAPTPVETQTVFGNTNPVVLEIGFGMGHATAEIAKVNPSTNYIGVEVHKPGVGALLDRIREYGLENLRIVHHDVVDVVETMIAPGMLSGLHVFFPDPWPKKKHNKRRLIQAAFLEKLATRCAPGAYLYLATDWEDYAQWMLAEIAQAPSWTNPHGGFCPPIEWRPSTAFERKGLAKDHIIREVYAIRS